MVAVAKYICDNCSICSERDRLVIHTTCRLESISKPRLCPIDETRGADWRVTS